MAVVGASVALCAPACSLLEPATTPPVVQVVVSAASPGNPLPEGLVGYNGPGPADASAPLAALGPGFVRTDVEFDATYEGAPVYDCATGAWNPASLDAKVDAIHSEGGTPLLIVDYSPTCLSADPTADDPQHYAPDSTPSDAQAWEALVEQMALHEITAEGVRYFEVWNEPDWVYFHGGLQAYLQLYSDTAHALEDAATTAGETIEVGGPALADVLGVQDTAWLDPFVAYVAQNGLPLDFLSWHTYFNDPYAGPVVAGGPPLFCPGPGYGANPCWYNPNVSPETLIDEVDQARQALAPYPQLDPALIVSEWNLSGSDTRVWGPYDAALVASVLQAASSDGVAGLCYYFIGDGTSNDLVSYGLDSPSGTPVPAYYSFLFWHEMAGDQVAVTVSPSQQIGDQAGAVGTVSTVSQNGAVYVLLYNFQPYDLTDSYGASEPTPTDRYVVLDVTGLKQGSTYTWQRLAVDATHTGTPVASGSTGTGGASQLMFTLPGDSVSLVTFSPSGVGQG